jgi:hypothetical protein
MYCDGPREHEVWSARSAQYYRETYYAESSIGTMFDCTGFVWPSFDDFLELACILQVLVFVLGLVYRLHSYLNS